MKRYLKLFPAIALGMLMGSCADDAILPYAVNKPESIAQYEYLNAYDALKSYIDRTKYPDFKLGIALTASEFSQKGAVYGLASTNFDEVTAGNAMKYASCVNDKGEMDFMQVMKFVTAAKSAGVTIYGHTLAWHAQQNNKYLNSLLADRDVEPDPSTADPGLHINTPEAKANPWDWELYYDLSQPLVVGQEYTMKMRAKASAATSFPFWPGLIDGSGTHYLAEFVAGEQWGETSVTFVPTAAIDRLRFCFGKFGGDLYMDDFSLTAKGSDVNLIANPSFAEEDLTGWSKPGWHGYSYVIEKIMENAATMIETPIVKYDFEDGTPIGGWGTGLQRTVEDGVCVITNPTAVDSWAVQLCHESTTPFEVGTTYFLRMKIKGTQEGKISAEFQNPEGYVGCGSLSPQIAITTDWTEVTIQGTCTGENALRLLFSIGNYAGTIYMDDLCLFTQKSSNTIPMTPEEKAEALTGAMSNWIEGMMLACEGYVTTWDVVNEALAGADKDGDGIYDLQSATRGTVSAEDAVNNFYWQDYLGDLEYVRTAIRLARKHFAESGGEAAALKLFINDYNLESDWDDNKKMKSIIEWIKRWEADGVTKVDGIGTQMHVSCYANAATQKSKEDHVVKMLELLKSSGKLVKISELDMGYVDENGKGLKTEELTEEQHKAMANYYKFIVKKYFEIIPVAQQYGITQWCITDSPADSGWRGGEPVGLWDLNYNRKHTYAGFTDGLLGK